MSQIQADHIIDLTTTAIPFLEQDKKGWFYDGETSIILEMYNRLKKYERSCDDIRLMMLRNEEFPNKDFSISSYKEIGVYCQSSYKKHLEKKAHFFSDKFFELYHPYDKLIKNFEKRQNIYETYYNTNTIFINDKKRKMKPGVDKGLYAFIRHRHFFYSKVYENYFFSGDTCEHMKIIKYDDVISKYYKSKFFGDGYLFWRTRIEEV